MSILDHLEPLRVFQFFQALCAIPHGSGNTKAISDWCVSFARQRGLEYYQDSSNNVIVIKEATPGREHAKPVILQGHLDMVCQQNASCTKDMEREGLDLAVEGDYVYAKGTTLGGDDGIAVAMILALLDAKDIPHPRLEAVFTTDEEVGMLGASALDVSPLRGRTMINLDSEEEGIFTVSCAGGVTAACTLPIHRTPFPGTALTIRVEGLTGGHSGTEIDKGRANANLLLGRLLHAAAQSTQLRLQWAEGGQKDNAIPTAARAGVVVADAPRATEAVQAMETVLRQEYALSDPELCIQVNPGQADPLPMDEVSTGRAVCMLLCLPNGVQAMSQSLPGLVQTSLNLGILTTGPEEIRACFSVRSSVESQKQLLKERLACLTAQLGGRTACSGEYAGWPYAERSPLREQMVEVFCRQYGKAPSIQAIHAGLECGIFAGKLPGLDCVSIGPDILDIHTPRERLSIASVQRVWAFLLEVLDHLQ